MSYFRTYEKSELKGIDATGPGERRWPFVQIKVMLCRADGRRRICAGIDRR
jgi:hypothetical protein